MSNQRIWANRIERRHRVRAGRLRKFEQADRRVARLPRPSIASEAEQAAFFARFQPTAPAR